MEPITDIGRILAFSFATVSESDFGLGFKARALSQQLYPRVDQWTKHYWEHFCPSTPEKIAPGQWSLLLVTEPWYKRKQVSGEMKDYPSAVRYGFITEAHSDEVTGGQEAAGSRVIRADFETYLNQVVTGDDAEATRKHLLNGWKKLLDDMKPHDPEYRLGLCDVMEIESYLRSEHYVGVEQKPMDSYLEEKPDTEHSDV